MAIKIRTVMTYPLTGAVDFAITFEYLARKFVTVTLIGKDRKELVLNQDYRFTTKTQITTTRAWTAADGYDSIEIRRFTSATDRLVDFADGSILRAYDLNIAQIQTLHVAEEARDLTADTIGVNNDGHLDARGRRIVNLANAVDDRDAVPFGQLKTMNQNSWQARNEALQFRNEAETFRNKAEGFKNESSTHATNAKQWRDEANEFRNEAEQFKNTSGQYAASAGSSASNAKDSEDEARRIAERIKAAGLTGYITRRSFEKGFNVTTWNEVLLWEDDGEYYRWDGTLPKNVPAGSNPESSGGIGLGAWVSVGDASLRSQIASVTGFNLVGQVPDVTTLRNTEPTTASERILLREYTAGTGYGGGQLRAVLDGSSYVDNGVTVFKTTGGAAWVRVNADIVNPLMAGAVPDGVTPCSSAINAMFAASKRMQFTGGDYLLDATITLQSDRSVDFGASRLIQGTSLANHMFAIRGSNSSSTGGVFVGTGTRTNAIASAIIVDDASYSKVSGAIVRRAPGAGIQMLNCTRCSIINCISENNWGNGLEDRYGNFNEIINSIGNYNGYLSETEISNKGRGCLVWKSTGTTFRGNQTFGNSEYGIRVYSQTGDDAITGYIHIFDHISVDNGKIDIYIYNDAGSLLNIELSNCHVHRWNQSNSGSAMVALQGTRCHWNGGSITKYGDIYDAAAVSFSNGDNITFENTSITNVTSAFSNTANNTTVRNCTVNSSLVITGTGTGSTVGYLTFEACSFNHTGAGTTDIAVTVTSATRLNGCYFNGFYRNVVWTNEPLILTACHSTNTTGEAIRMYGDGVGAFYSSGCRWDVATVPAWLGSLVKQGSALPVLYNTAAPTTLTWPRGSKCINSAPTVGSPKGWVCTVAGTPGTWVSEGNL